MKYLYVDNFRGFQDTYIPIKDVNFLVGENSTGKTSILSLMNVISDPSFWMYQNFNNDEVQLGTYKDIASVKPSLKRKFKVGVIDTDVDNRHHQTFLISFHDYKDMPIADKYDLFEQQQEVSFLFGKEKIRYKISDVSNDESQSINARKIFENWTRRDKVFKGYKYTKGKIPFPSENYLAFAPGLLNKKVEEGKIEIMSSPPNPFGNFVWIAPVRSKPLKTYDKLQVNYSPEGSHTPYLIRDFLKNRQFSEKFKTYLSQFGKNSGLFDEISIREYGSKRTDPFALIVILEGIRREINMVGYGVSQNLPVIAEMFFRNNGSYFAIQQPEVHLHPKAQSALGDVFHTLAVKDEKKFLVETHSDFVIDRFRQKVSKSDDEVSSQVLFFERKDNRNIVTPIEILPNGEYSEKQPDSFREFFFKEELNNLRIG